MHRSGYRERGSNNMSVVGGSKDGSFSNGRTACPRFHGNYRGFMGAHTKSHSGTVLRNSHMKYCKPYQAAEGKTW